MKRSGRTCSRSEYWWSSGMRSAVCPDKVTELQAQLTVTPRVQDRAQLIHRIAIDEGHSVTVAGLQFRVGRDRTSMHGRLMGAVTHCVTTPR